MKVEGLSLCVGCMHPLNDQGQCEHCHLDQKSYRAVPRHLLPGTVLAERYILGRVIGEGNFGITYIGWDKIQELIVAVKECYPADLVNREVVRGSSRKVHIYGEKEKVIFQKELEHFLKEAECLNRFISEPAIVSVRDFFHENDTGYLVMDYVEGIQVKKYIREHGRLSAERVLQMMEPVIRSLGHIHKAGLLHRDISPDNLIIRDQQLVLIDFGAARVRNFDKTRSITVMYKDGFSPEEQYRKKGKQGTWSDVYAVCATMYFMMTGIVPEEAIQRLLMDETRPLAEYEDVVLSAGKKAAIMKGMSVLAQDRFQTMEELYQELYAQNNDELSVQSAPLSPLSSSEIRGALKREEDGKNPEGQTDGDKRPESRKLPVKENGGDYRQKPAAAAKDWRWIMLTSIFVLMIGMVGYLAWRGKYSSSIRSAEPAPAVSEEMADLGEGQEETVSRKEGNVQEGQNIDNTSAPAASDTKTEEEAKKLVMPDLTGWRAQRAKKKLRKMAGTNVMVILKKQYDSSTKKGKIFRQKPEKGTSWRTEKKKTIYLWVSRGERAEKKTSAPTRTEMPGTQAQTGQAPKAQTQKKQTERPSEKETDTERFAGVIG